MEWEELDPGVQWVLRHDKAVVLQVMKLGPYIAATDASYRVTGGESFSDHRTAAEAMAAAEASAREQFGLAAEE